MKFVVEVENNQVKSVEIIEAEEITIGDVVTSGASKMIVTRISDKGEISGFGEDRTYRGCVFALRDAKEWKKTGEHFPIAEILDSLRLGRGLK